MNIYIVLGLLCVTSACSIFLGHAAGYHRAKRVTRRKLENYGIKFYGEL